MCTVSEILHGYIERHGGPILADALGTSVSNVYRMLNPNDEMRGLWVTQLIPLIRATNDFTVLDHIEAQLGRVAISTGSETTSLDAKGLCRFMQEAGEALKTVGDSMADGRVSKPEARECLRALMDLVRVAMGLMEQCRTIIDT